MVTTKAPSAGAIILLVGGLVLAGIGFARRILAAVEKRLNPEARNKHQRLRPRLIPVSLSSTTTRSSRMAPDRQASVILHLVRRVSAQRQRATTLRAQPIPVMHERQNNSLLRLIPLRLRTRRNQPAQIIKLIRRPRLPPMKPLQRNTKRKRRFYI